jgi:hypothetical protein
MFMNSKQHLELTAILVAVVGCLVLFFWWMLRDAGRRVASRPEATLTPAKKWLIPAVGALAVSVGTVLLAVNMFVIAAISLIVGFGIIALSWRWLFEAVVAWRFIRQFNSRVRILDQGIRVCSPEEPKRIYSDFLESLASDPEWFAGHVLEILRASGCPLWRVPSVTALLLSYLPEREWIKSKDPTDSSHSRVYPDSVPVGARHEEWVVMDKIAWSKFTGPDLRFLSTNTEQITRMLKLRLESKGDMRRFPQQLH